ncbi:MAG: histidinol-phosphate transaminase [Prevotellaceae bacterium]|nr:histidinol-phosphate transaminase [Prevotellaceae bacterium]
MELRELVRDNIWNLTPYSCARNEYSDGNATVFLDANESPYHCPLNRYPDPLQRELKREIARLKGVREECIFLGNGSDEAIDLVLRIFCEPGQDNVVAISPSYGMYEVAANINDVEYRPVLLNESFDLCADSLLAATDERTKLIFLCSPNNPTGNSLSHEEVEKVLRQFKGIVVVDEAYGDFSSQKPFREELQEHENLVVLNTLSKAWASAAIRLGMAFAKEEIISLMNRVKYPYNISLPTQREAIEVLKHQKEVEEWVRLTQRERERVTAAFARLPLCKEVFPTDANFFLARVDGAESVYRYLLSQGIVVRDRSRVRLCEDCLRITIGTPEENNALLNALRPYKG